MMWRPHGSQFGAAPASGGTAAPAGSAPATGASTRYTVRIGYNCEQQHHDHGLKCFGADSCCYCGES